MNTYNVYITDTFAGELNYCWVTKFKVKANTERGAVWKVARQTGFKFRYEYEEVWKAKNACIGLVIDDEEYPQYDYDNATEL